jgi:uncharacterized protein
MEAREQETQVVDNPGVRRYEMFLDGELVGFLDYVLDDGHIVLPYIEIEPAFEGRGLGGRLAEAVLLECRARGLTVKPECPFIVRYIREHPEHADLIAR